MAEFYKIIIVTIVCALFTLILREHKVVFSSLLSITMGLIIISIVLSKITKILTFFNEVVSLSNIDYGVILIIIKAVVIGYIADFASSLCNDTGNTSLSNKIGVLGKVMIFIESMPLLETLFSMVIGLIV